MRRKTRMAIMLGLAAMLFAISVALFWTIQPVWGSFALGASIISGRLPTPERLEKHVRMLSEQFFPRDWTHPENLDRAAKYIHDELAQAGGRMSEQEYQVDSNTYRNVIASFGPESGERIVVGAHYDAFGMLPGADDNASGVAGLIEMARLLQAKPLPIRIDLVAFTLEEPDTAIYRNANYHTEHDTPDTLDYRRMALVVEGVHAVVRDLAGSN